MIEETFELVPAHKELSLFPSLIGIGTHIGNGFEYAFFMILSCFWKEN